MQQLTIDEYIKKNDLNKRRQAIDLCRSCKHKKYKVIIKWHDKKGNSKDIVKRDWIHQNCFHCSSYFATSWWDKAWNEHRSMYEKFKGEFETEIIDELRATELKRFNAF